MSDHADTARAFHEAYERLAPSFGYETRKESAVPWEDVPANNRDLMTAVCAEVVGALVAERDRLREALLVFGGCLQRNRGFGGTDPDVYRKAWATLDEVSALAKEDA